MFHSPDHDHARCAADAIAEAEARCTARGLRFTPMRRQVLGVMVEGHRPFGAYEIMDRLAETGPRPAPITVYRALDFLLENGLVHRIASRNAFVACLHEHGESEDIIFLICERCGSVSEAPSASVREALDAAARQAGFQPTIPLIEVSGICAHCRDAGSAS